MAPAKCAAAPCALVTGAIEPAKHSRVQCVREGSSEGMESREVL
jgi:hypothetical protein